MLSFADLRAANLTRCKRWHPGGLADWSLSDWAVALQGEAGEACNVIKKMNRERDHITGNAAGTDVEQLRRDLAHELADTMIYLDLLAAAAGINLAAAVIEKFNIVSERVGFPDRLKPSYVPAGGEQEHREIMREISPD
ncbi:MAG: MazG-like family protein [Alphaproteobacteria bacterium]